MAGGDTAGIPVVEEVFAAHFSLFAGEGLRLVLGAQKKTMNVRPKLFQLVTGGIQQYLCAQNVGAACERMGAGMVRIGEACGQAITEEFGEVELSFPDESERVITTRMAAYPKR